MKAWLLGLLGVLWLGLATAVGAAVRVDDFYRARVAMPEGASESLDGEAVAEALRQVVSKLSGQQTLDDNQLVGAAMRRPSALVSEFSFQTQPLLDEYGSPRGEQRYLDVSFLQAPVLRLLREAGLPIWPAVRPVVVVWVVIDDYQQRDWLSASSRPQLAQWLVKQAQQRAIPFVLPLGDLDDDMAISLEDAWQQRFDLLEIASRRYGADAYMFARVTQTSTGRWLGSWALQVGEEQRYFNRDAADAESFMQAGVDAMSDWLASQFAVHVAATEQGVVRMQIDGIANFDDYQAVNKLLVSLPGVEDANVVQVSAEAQYFELRLSTDLSQLQNVIGLDGRLQLQALSELDVDVDLHYRWQEYAQ